MGSRIGRFIRALRAVRPRLARIEGKAELPPRPWPRKWTNARAYAEFAELPFDEPCPSVSKEQLDRRERSQRRLEAEGVPVLHWHSVIEAESEIEPRHVSDVADRLVALCLVAAKAEGLLQGRPPEEVREVIGGAIREQGAEFLFTPDERAFIDALEPDRNNQVQFYWRYEAAWVLLWALRWVDGPLSMPCRPQDSELVTDMVRDEQDLAERGLRPIAELLDEADLI